MKKLLILLLVATFAAPLHVDGQAGTRKKAEEKAGGAYGGLFDDVKGLSTAASDFITLRMAGDKVWFEIPRRYMGREMLMASTLSGISAERFGDIGYKNHEPVHIRFTMRDSVVDMRRINTALTTDFAHAALDRVNIDPIMYSYPVQAWGADSASVVIEMGELFLDNPAIFDFFKDGAASPTLKKESSSLDAVKAFADNLSVKSTLAFSVSADGQEGYPVTARVTRSILLLPEDKMRPRLTDSRVGVFTTDKTRFTGDSDVARPYSLANRWRLVPSDMAAYVRGEAVEPVKKIVFYVSPDFPEVWGRAIKRGIESWQPAFEEAGFRNAIVARDFPTAEEDPDFDPDNLKYSCVRFLPSTTVNAMGPSWVDPSTGEIINASIIVWSNVLELINTWRFVQTAQLDPRVRARKMPDAVIEESLVYVIAHEVGHTLGFPHNMASSAAFPVDSLRSVTFTRKYGTTPSIMDYARHNYIAQREDRGVRLTPPDLGVYDYYAIKWLYKYLPQFADEWDERALVGSWADAVAGDPVYRYGRQQPETNYDPSALMEDLGDDPMRAGDYGIRNLKYILSHLEEWIADDPDYQHRKMLYKEICDQYARYIGNVMANVGGIYLTEVKEGTAGRHIAPVPREVQRASLRWVIDEYRNMEWIDQAWAMRGFPLGVDGAAVLRVRLGGDFRDMIAKVVLSSHYSDAPYTVREFTDDLYAATWEGVLSRRAPSEGEKMFQGAMVAMFCAPLTGDNGEAASDDLQSSGGDLRTSRTFGPAGMGYVNTVDVSAIDDSDEYLTDLAMRSRDLLRRAVAFSRGGARIHYQALLVKLNSALKDKL